MELQRYYDELDMLEYDKDEFSSENLKLKIVKYIID
jgi:hypothetical protein